MIESVFVIVLACLAFFALFQYADLFTAKVVLSHAAARAARSRAVGFNRWMVEKSARVAAIPASGRRLAPPSAGPSAALSLFRQLRPGAAWDTALRNNFRSPSAAIEVARVPDYMDSFNSPTSSHILDYELWDALSVDVSEPLNIDGVTPSALRVTVRQRHPLLLSLARLAEGALSDAGGDRLSLASSFEIESHHSLYLEDMNW